MQLSKNIDIISFVGRKKHQREVFWDLAQDQMRFLYNVALKYTGNRSDAEDLVQETLTTGYDKFHQLRDRKKFKSWTLTILRNHFLKWHRKRQPVQLNEYDDGMDLLTQLETVSMQPDTETVYEKKEEAELIQSILDKLPENYKTILILYYMEDSSYKDIAEMLGVPIGTVMSRLSRGRKIMKKALLRSMVSKPQANKVIQLNVKR